MDISHLEGAEIALVLMGRDRQGDEDWAILEGRGVVKGGELYIERQSDDLLFPVPREALGRAKKVTKDLAEILRGAEWCIPLTVGPVDEDIDPYTLESAGFIWPE